MKKRRKIDKPGFDPKTDTKVVLVNMADLAEEHEQEALRQRELHPKDPHHWYGFLVDKAGRTISLWWGGYQYDIELERIPDPLALLEWTTHFAYNKTWPGMTPKRIARFIIAVCEEKGWQLWRGV